MGGPSLSDYRNFFKLGRVKRVSKLGHFMTARHDAIVVITIMTNSLLIGT